MEQGKTLTNEKYLPVTGFIRKRDHKEITMQVDRTKLTPPGNLFMEYARTLQGGNLIGTDLRFSKEGNGDKDVDDLTFPIVRLRSRIPSSERMRRFGVEALQPMDCSGKHGPQGHPIPTEDYISRFVHAYGDKHGSRTFTLEPYADAVVSGKMSVEEAINSAGTDLVGMIEAGEFEIA